MLSTAQLRIEKSPLRRPISCLVLTDRSQWRGQNLLGITLMRVRDALAMN